ncbi:acyltransferase family protein, partial [Roseiarcus sp.]
MAESLEPRPPGGQRRKMRLSDYAVGRDNNFNLIRFVAALSVLFGHSVGVLGLPSAYEFFFDHLGLSLAEMAVDVFFVASGFLVTASLINRG